MIGKRLNSQRRAYKRLPLTSVPALRNHCRILLDSNAGEHPSSLATPRRDVPAAILARTARISNTVAPEPFRRPQWTPAACARLMPLFTRSTISDRSNSAIAAIMVKSNFPDGVEVSHEFDRLMNAMPKASKSARELSRCRVDRPNLSSL